MLSVPCWLELLLDLFSPQRDPDEVNLPLSDWSKASEDLAVVHKQEHPVPKSVSEEAGNGRKVVMRHLCGGIFGLFLRSLQSLGFLTNPRQQFLLGLAVKV